MKKKPAAKKAGAKKPVGRKAAKPAAAKSSAKPAAKAAPAAPAARPQVYSPKPIEGLGWQPFRYPLS